MLGQPLLRSLIFNNVGIQTMILNYMKINRAPKTSYEVIRRPLLPSFFSYGVLVGSSWDTPTFHLRSAWPPASASRRWNRLPCDSSGSSTCRPTYLFFENDVHHLGAMSRKLRKHPNKTWHAPPKKYLTQNYTLVN